MSGREHLDLDVLLEALRDAQQRRQDGPCILEARERGGSRS